MKKIVSVLALALALVGTGAFAQGDNPKACSKEQKACCKTDASKGDEYTNTKPGCGDSCTNSCSIKGGACKCGAACAAEVAQEAKKGCCKKDGEAKKCDKTEVKACNKDKKACDKKEAKACDKSKKCDKKDAKACNKDKKACDKKK